ncbi:hypothetical protein VM1G_03657 [Cytospora mali]|uniref:SMP-30/Gluconolactonase/LRE-like region domain-containing protein n=1 Tax=Cytospora mali TaxID=578113 RepID=A0A194VXS4_CYTMA|nr:hypothetical protein VM1G_03657 [Valsa mali]
MLLSLVATIASAVGYTAAAKTISRSNSSVHTLYEFPGSTFVENLAVRPNGQILVDVLTAPQLWLVDPTKAGEAILVHEFAGAQGVGGIAEYKPDVFAVLAGNVSLTTGQGEVGSWSVWSIDLGGVDITSNASVSANPPKLSKIADLPAAQLPNGMAVISSEAKDILIVGDFNIGTIYSVDIETGDSAVVMNNTYTAPAAEYGFGSAATDGVQIVDDMLYFTNLGQGNLYRVALNVLDGTPVGEIETVAQIPSSLDQWDDFTFDSEGNVFVVTGGANTIEKINVHTGKVTTVAGNLNSTLIAEPTSAKFGRRSNDTNVLYVTTAGGLFAPVNGDITVAGSVVAINTGSKGSC